MTGITDEAAVEVHDLIHGAERRASQDNYSLVTSGLLELDDDDDDNFDAAAATPRKAAGEDKPATLGKKVMDKTKNILGVNKV